MTPESKVKREIKRLLTQPGVYQFWPVQTGYGAATLDCLACVKGQFVAIEVKRPGLLVPSPRQRVTMDAIEAAHGWAFCVDSVEAFVEQLTEGKTGVVR